MRYLAMKQVSFIILTFLIAILLPATAYADFSFIWAPPTTDKSIQYLGAIFGTVGTALTGTGSSIIGSLFNVFNIAVLALGSLVVSYTIVLSTVNTAQEGHVMGQKWSSIWIPMKSLAGIAFLLPTSSGYSLIQIFLMNVIIYGIAAADQVWGVVVNNIGTPQSVMGQPNIDNDQLQSTASQLFNNMVCAQVINNDPTCKAAMNNRTVGIYRQDNQINIGISGDNNYASVCGTITPNAAPPGVDSNLWTSANMSGIQSAAGNLSSAAQELYTSSSSATWTSQNVIYTAMNSIQTSLSSVTATQANSNNNLNSNANDGWLFAGSYYFNLVSRGTQNINFLPPSTSGGDLSVLGNACSTQVYNYQALIGPYLDKTEVSGTGQSNSGGSLQLQTPNLSVSSVVQFYDAITTPVRKLTFQILNSITTNQDDPLTSLAYVGSTIMSVCEITWFSMMIISFLILVICCVMSGIASLCWAVSVTLSLLIPFISFVIVLLWGAGVLLGLYLPLVPYIVFSFTALGWFILVVEAMAAAPILALGFASPSTDHLGRASNAVLIITNVFLRPTLMVIGFMIGIKLLQAIVAMVNYGFQSTIEASTGGLGIFGCVVLICLYGGLVTMIVHECFSLVYIIPDKIIRWIGGTAEHSSVKQSTQEVRQSAEKGGEIGSSAIKGSSKFASEKSGEFAKEAKKKMGGGGDGGGGKDGGGGGEGGGGGLQVA